MAVTKESLSIKKKIYPKLIQADLFDFEESINNLLPPLKWAGGKRWLLPIINEYWFPYRSSFRLLEPFCGGISISLGLRPQYVWINDINQHLINFYQWLQKGLIIDIVLENNKDLYLSYRKKFNDEIKTNPNSKLAAMLFYYLNRTGYNGLCRFNSKGGFNVPFGQYNEINYVYDFSSYSKVMKNWKITSLDFQEIEPHSNDFLYIDPPYDVEFTKYSKEDFTWEDQIRLVEWLTKLNNPIVVSNQATDRIIDLYSKYKFTVKILDAPRKISCTGDRTKVKEVLAIKNL